ncbi:transcriptional regulator [Agromyces rhizosphaerae]|uniref:Transcriptional regulator n=1 Tax=Agromyces rhizosphaerae TaxID=88374 RepID=A0A9W6FNI9_9MICO|nr:GntR family transcriptional regulator [Agromyces rhizosphaerae]GLI26551.1 transcriptional regulator [Agromyces rhizosphaerae]
MSAEDAAEVADAARTTRGGDAGARVADRLRHEILAGEHAPGTRIRQEDVAERFGASRVPVREALRILENEGLVTLVANTGAWVATLTLAECEEVYQMRERLEPLLLSYSAPHLSPDDLADLAELAERMAATDDLDLFLGLDRKFHLASYRGARTSQLGELVTKLWNTTQPYRRAYTHSIDADARRIMHDEHHLLVSALRDDDLEEAQRVLASHIRRTRRQLSRHPELFTDLGAPR